MEPKSLTYRIKSKINLKTQVCQIKQPQLLNTDKCFLKKNNQRRKSNKNIQKILIPVVDMFLKKKDTIVQKNKIKQITLSLSGAQLVKKMNNWVFKQKTIDRFSIPRTKTDIQQNYEINATTSYYKQKINQQNKQNCKQRIKTKNRYHKKEDLDLKLKNLQNPNAQIMEQLLKVNKIHPKRCLTGENIMKLQQNNQYTRFHLHQLYSSFQTLLSFSESSFKKFLKGFEMFLNIYKITIRSEIIEQQWQKVGNQINFHNYLKVFKKMQNLIYKQTITDYLQIILESCDNHTIFYNDILSIYYRRYDNRYEAQQNALYLFTKLGKQKSVPISKKQIYDLCFIDEKFCTDIYRLYAKQIRPDSQKIQKKS